jgi:hypothetical protein
MALRLTKKDQNTSDTKWVDYDADTKVLLARIDNTAYEVAIERERRKQANADAQFGVGVVGVIEGEATEYNIHCKLFSQFILKDWSGVLDEDGNPLPYSQEAGDQLLSSNVAFFMFVKREATKAAVEAHKALAETVGKSLPASSGNASGAETPKSAD